MFVLILMSIMLCFVLFLFCFLHLIIFVFGLFILVTNMIMPGIKIVSLNSVHFWTLFVTTHRRAVCVLVKYKARCTQVFFAAHLYLHGCFALNLTSPSCHSRGCVSNCQASQYPFFKSSPSL